MLSVTEVVNCAIVTDSTVVRCSCQLFCLRLTTATPCSSVYLLAPLQWVLNDAARFVADAHRAHMSAVLWSHYTGFQLLQTVCAYARRLQRNPSFVTNGCNNTDLVIARTSSASFSNDDRIRHPSHQDKIWRQSFLCCWTSRMERSPRRYKEHYRLVILQTSHQDILFFVMTFGLNIPDSTMFGASGQFLGGVRCAI